jgi:hypothetical protein
MFCATKIMNVRAWTSLWTWQVFPCTVAVVAGPLITTVYHLSWSPDAAEGSFSLAQALRGILCLMMFLSLFLSRRLRLLEHRIIRPLMFLSIYAVLTCVLSSYPYEDIVFVVKLAFMAFVFASAFHLAQNKLCSESWLTACAWIVLLLMAISIAIGLWTGNTVEIYRSEYATAGLIDQPAVTSALLISVLPVFLSFFPKSWSSLAGVMVFFISLFFTMRRTELIAATVAILCVLFRNINPFRPKIPWRLALLVALVLCVLIVIGLRTQAGQDLLTRMSDLNPSKGSGSGRYIFWPICLNHILNRDISAQIFGEGMGSIRDVMSRHFDISIGSHTDWLDLTYAFGLFGLMAIVWWYFELIRLTNYLRTIRDPTFQGALSAIVIFFLISIGQGGFPDTSLALTYAALGFWAGRVSYNGRQVHYAGCAFNRTVQF